MRFRPMLAAALAACGFVVLLMEASVQSAAIATESADRALLPPVDRSGVHIRIGRNVQVSVAHWTWMHSEMHIAADPRDYRKLVACSIMGSSQQSSIKEERDIVYSSDDQGLTWSPQVSSVGASDPTCAYTSRGTALFAAVHLGRQEASEIYRSPDGGSSWRLAGDVPPLDNPAVTAGLADEKAAVWIGGVDLGGITRHYHGPCDGSFFPLVAVRSSDDGKSFLQPVTLISAPKGYCLSVAGGAATFSDGMPVYPVLEIHQPPLDSPNLPGKPNAQIGVARITQHGVVVSTIRRIYSNYTADWATSKVVLAIDKSHGIYRNRMYAVWSDWRTGRCEVLLSYSDDLGATWATPRIINDDHRFGNGRFGPDDTQVMLAVNRYGVVGVAWYSRAESKDDLGWVVRFRASLDGGNTWVPSMQVSDAVNTFTVPRNWSNDFQVQVWGDTIEIIAGYHAYQFFTGGDYSGMDADADGVFHAIWSDDRTGVSQMWTSQVRVLGVAHRGPLNRGKPDYVLPATVQLPPVPWYTVFIPRKEPRGMPRLSGISDVRYDVRTSTFSFNVRVKNASSKPMHGPWQLHVENVQSSHGDAEVTHADSGGTGVGAVWTFHAGSGDFLKPGELSAPRRIFVRLAHERPFRLSDFWLPVRTAVELARVRYRIETP